ncbi:MAG TPA: hypothetical protein VLQ90_13785 [Pyrinomonadaceae bacterium]|nr:hypothetical protein [Pyrinomonadaceae bacterium]
MAVSEIELIRNIKTEITPALMRRRRSMFQYGLGPARRTTQLAQVIGELEKLKRIDGATPHAERVAKFYIFETYSKRGAAFPTPMLIADGEGGLVISWSANGRRVRLSCRAEFDQQTYLYYESPEVYDIEPDLTPEILEGRLDWLNDR